MATKKYILMWMLWLFAFGTTIAQRGLRQAEYFIDTDPGVGLGTPVNAVDGSINSVIEALFKNGISPGSPGFHTLNVRVRDSVGTWGPVFRYVFHTTTSLTLRSINVNAGEFFWDTDPGVGNGTAFLALDGSFNDAIEVLSSGIVPSPTIGMHVLHMRVQDNNGTWGPTYKHVVNVVNPLSVRNIRIAEAEMFWDNDPGAGNGIIMLAFDGNFNDAIEAAVRNSPAPSIGMHALHVRVKDHSGTWGPVFRTIVNVTDPLNVRNIRVSQAEYFWNTDPGQGNGNILLAFDGNFNDAVESVTQNGSLPGLGNHVLHIRTRDHAGTWGPTFRTVIHVSDLLAKRPIRIRSGELFFDTDPGAGNGTPLLAFDGNFSDAIETALRSVTAPGLGNHILHVRVRDTLGTWGPVFRTILQVTDSLPKRNILVKQGEFFFNTDPGQGNGFPLLALDGNFNNAIEALKQSWNFFPDTGFQVLNVRVKGANNQWGPVFRTVVKILPCASPPVVSISPNTTQQICPGNIVNFTATPGFSSYTWFRGGTIVGTGQTYQADTIGYYRVYAIDNNGCGVFSAFTQVQQTPVNVNINPSGPLAFCQGNQVTLNAGNGFVSYQWNTGHTTSAITVSSSGQYIVTVTNSNNCIAKDTVQVTVHNLPAVPLITSSGPTIFCPGGNVQLTVNSADTLYYWNTYATTQSITVANPGTYTVTVTNANNCTRTNSIVIQHYPQPISSYSNNVNICTGDSAQLFVNGGVSYQWLPVTGLSNASISNPKASPTTSTQYKVIVTGIGGCVDSALINVFVNPLPVVNASATIPTCEGQSLLLFANPSGAGSYSWIGPNGFVSATQNPVIASSNISHNGMYIVTATNPGGCFSKDTVIVSGINPSPTIAILGNTNLCLNDTLNLNVVPNGLTYQWTGPNGFSATTQSIQINQVNISNAGNYIVQAVNSNGCGATTQTNVNIGGGSFTLNLSGSNNICEGNAITINTSPSNLHYYNWTGPGGYVSTNQNVYISPAQVANSGWYKLVAGYTGNCSYTAKDSIYIQVNTQPVAQILNSQNNYCAGDSVQLTAGSGASNYLWTGPNGFISTQQNPWIYGLQGYHSGAYFLTATNASGCNSQTSFSITVNPAPLPNATTNAPILCVGDDLLLFANPAGMNYQWTGPNGFSSTDQNPIIDSATTAMQGTYFVTVSNMYGCSASTQTQVFISAHPQISIVNNTVFCEGQTLQLFSTPNGMATYQWTGPNNFNSPLQNPSIPQVDTLASGYYVLHVMNIYGCTDTDSIFMQVYPRPNITVSGTTAVCDGETIQLSVSPSGYAGYQWTGPSNYSSNLQNPSIPSATELMEGSYIVTVTNVYGCTDNDVLYVNVYQGPQVSVTFQSPLCEGETLSFNTIPSGMVSYTWSGPNGFTSNLEDPVINSVTTSHAGYYTVTVNNGLCNTTVSHMVMVNSMPNTAVLQTGTVLTSLQGGAAYQWLNCSNNSAILGEVSQTYTATANGSYAAVVILNGCIDTTACYDIVGLSLDDENTDWHWGIYPNPNEGHFFIQGTQPAVYELMDMSGKMLGVYEVYSYPYEVKVLLPAGMYFIREQKHGTVQKVVIK
ncbi:MAG: T9SS type A sorting domain-containing protein [Flavobacteriales bacterium]|nr:T9SS type A sorting domain-containing protein [Flavobacteriales bacterium]